MLKYKRINIHQADIRSGNIARRYEIEKAAWIWIDNVDNSGVQIVEFENCFELKNDTTLIFHVSADNRYKLYLNDKLISRGPDRSDLAHWSFASYSVQLPAGKHCFKAVVLWSGEFSPHAQFFFRPGFIFASEGKFATRLNTDSGNWKCRKINGLKFDKNSNLNEIGAFSISDIGLLNKKNPWKIPTVVMPPLETTYTGGMRPGWRLHPSCLRDQINRQLSPGKIIAASNKSFRTFPVSEDNLKAPCLNRWNMLINSKKELEITANSQVNVLWDLDNYYCAFLNIAFRGGNDGTINCFWAESLYEQKTENKGDRNEIIGKVLNNPNGDSFINSTGELGEATTPWWRSGRYIMIEINTKNQPLTITKLNITETRYPLDTESSICLSKESLNELLPLMLRGLQMCSHETYLDCPYYEQLMYVADTRIEALMTYIAIKDSRLPRRAIELFDFSRSNWGFIAEHYPGRMPQLSSTFSMFWVLMLHDYVMWREADKDWLNLRLTAMRSMLENFYDYLNDDYLLKALPGWSFIDWTKNWAVGAPPDSANGVSSICNLLFIIALNKAAELEKYFGDDILSQRYLNTAKKVGTSIHKKFWVKKSKLIADDISGEKFSEHAQCLAILSGILNEQEIQQCFESLINVSKLEKVSCYFSFYLFEVLALFKRGDLIVKYLDNWHAMKENGLKTTPERPEPSRSDCHAWSGHPFFHYFTTFAGIRPLTPDFSTVLIDPVPGNLKEIKGEMPHPKGKISFDMQFKHGEITFAKIDLPENVSGILKTHKNIELKPGSNHLTQMTGDFGKFLRTAG
jgi:hypothetical protein